MATTRIMPLHVGKGRTESRAISDIIDYVSNDNVIDLPISYSKDLVVYNSSKIAGYTFSSVPQFFEIDNVQPAE